MDINLGDVLPTAPGQEIWDYFALVVLAFQLLLLGLLFTGTLRDVIFVAVSVTAAFADKLYIFGFLEEGNTTINAVVNYHTTESFLTYGARCVMFIMPLIISTQTKIKSARATAIITAILAITYMIARWFVQQYPASDLAQADVRAGVAQFVLMSQFLIVGWVWSTAYHRRP
ncbi:MAG: hypothetical protein ACLFTK_12315 [Anaerolineales bacterium]